MKIVGMKLHIFTHFSVNIYVESSYLLLRCSIPCADSHLPLHHQRIFVLPILTALSHPYKDAWMKFSRLFLPKRGSTCIYLQTTSLHPLTPLRIDNLNSSVLYKHSTDSNRHVYIFRQSKRTMIILFTYENNKYSCWLGKEIDIASGSPSNSYCVILKAFQIVSHYNKFVFGLVVHPPTDAFSKLLVHNMFSNL